MRLTIKNAKGAEVVSTSIPNRLDVHIDGVEAEDLLFHIDIVTAIHYYGVIEILDTIGEVQFKSELKERQCR